MKNVNLSEQETTINLFRDDDTACLYTSDTTVMTKLDRRCKEFPSLYKLVKQDEYGKWYEFPKDRLSFKPPARVISDEERKILSQRYARDAEKINAARRGDTL